MRGVIYIYKLAIAIFLMLFFCSLFLSTSQAQETQAANLGNLDNLNVSIEVLPDSSLKVEQEFEGLTLYSSSFVWEIDSINFDELKIEENGAGIDSKFIDIQKGDVTRLSFPLSYYSNTNLKISYRSINNLRIINQKIFLKNIIFNRPGLYINNIQVNLNLPQDSTEAESGQRFYAIHGIEESSQKTESNNRLEYLAAEISSLASFTIEDSFFSDSVRFPLSQKAKFYFNNLDSISLILISLPLPILTLIFLLYLHLRFKNSVKIKRNLKPLNETPDDIPPALLGLLYYGEITELGVSATILDLIKKGIVLVVDKGEVITFGRKNTSIHLLPFEEKILGELFKQQKIKTSLKELSEIEERELVDPIFEKVYHEIYQIGSAKGYFERDPYRVKFLHHLTGTIIFFLSIILYILVIIFFPANPLMLLPAFGITIASLLILYLAKIIPDRTPAGKNELERWLSFKKYLLGHHPISDEKELALKYLPQAEALGATEEWILEFRKFPTETPPFYISAMPYVATSEWMIRTVNACRGIAEEIEELKGY